MAGLLRGLMRNLFALSAAGRGFFYATSLAHVALKILLGLRLALEEGYGMDTLVAPPQSIVFASGDVLVCFGFARLLDLVPEARRRAAHLAVLLPLFAFLVTSFIVHTYFKAFVNRGLLEFNGAGATELADYTLAGLTSYSLAFIAILVTLLSAYAITYAPVARAELLQRAAPAHFLLAASIAGVAYAGTLSSGQTGWIAVNPAYVLVKSYASASASKVRRATPKEVAAFRAPSGMGGHYDNRLDVTVPARPRSNVLFLMIESLPLEQTSLGGKPEQLPVLAELAKDGVSFDHFRSVFPATSRSFLTYHCGIYPTTGAATATKYSPGYRCDSLLDVLKGAGYRTGFFTAPMFTYDNLHRSNVVRSYDTYADFLSLHKKARRNDVDAPAVEEEVVVDALFQFLDSTKQAPWFATYFMFWNHAPYRLPFEDISALPPLERYKRTLSYLNDVLTGLLSRAKKAGYLDNTIVVVTADHGEGFGLHHTNTNHVGHIYEDDVRIPFVIHVPGLGAHVSARNASNVDVAPTLTRLLGLPRPTSWQGQDMLDERFESRPTLLFGRASFTTNGLVDGHYKYIEYVDAGTRHLYDLERDPHEQHDILATERSRADRYKGLIERWLPVAEARAWAVAGK